MSRGKAVWLPAGRVFGDTHRWIAPLRLIFTPGNRCFSDTFNIYYCNTKPTPPPQPPIPAGLVIGDRTIDRQDIGEYFAYHGVPQPWPAILTPAASARNSANVSAWVQRRHGQIARSIAPMWVDSDQATWVSVSLGEAALNLDAIQADDDVLTVHVRDQFGNAAKVSGRAYRLASRVESIEASVRVDAQGRLLPLTVVRLSLNADGTLTATRDSGFGESLTVSYRVVPTGTDPRVFIPTKQIVIPAGESNVTFSIEAAHSSDVLMLRAGNGYTPAPHEGDDQIQFISSRRLIGGAVVPDLEGGPGLSFILFIRSILASFCQFDQNFVHKALPSMSKVVQACIV